MRRLVLLGLAGSLALSCQSSTSPPAPSPAPAAPREAATSAAERVLRSLDPAEPARLWELLSRDSQALAMHTRCAPFAGVDDVPVDKLRDIGDMLHIPAGIVQSMPFTELCGALVRAEALRTCGPRPRLLRVEGSRDAAVAHIACAGAERDLAFVAEDGAWKLDLASTMAER